jgi:hypothetical protein
MVWRCQKRGKNIIQRKVPIKVQSENGLLKGKIYFIEQALVKGRVNLLDEIGLGELKFN